jgi:hypothetical protein
MDSEIDHKVFTLAKEDFNEVAIQLFKKQYQENSVYQQYVNALQVDVNSVVQYKQIPFLPISFFKTHRVACNNFEPEVVFESSGTTQAATSTS